MKKPGSLFLKTLNLEPGELNPFVLLLLFSFFIGIALSFFFTVSISSFLVNFSDTELPYAYLLSGLLSFTLWLTYERLGSRFAFSTTVLVMLIVLLLVVVALGVSNILYPGKWLAMSFLAWVAAFVFIKNVCFWGMASRLFNISQGKRLFGMINSGEVISNIVGFFSVPVLLPVIGATGLLVISMVAVLCCTFVASFIIKKNMQVIAARAASIEEKSVGKIVSGKDHFFKLMLIFSVVPVFIFYFIDFQFLSLAKKQFGSVEAMATFMGFFLGTTSVAELILRSVVFSNVLRLHGLKAGISCLCGCLLFSSVLAAIAGGWGTGSYFYFAVIALCKLLERSVSNGIHAPSVQLLYQPISPAVRTRMQGKLEGISGTIGNLAAGGIILLLLAFQVTALIIYLYLLLLALAAWALLISSVYTAYKQKLQEVLLSRRNLQPGERGAGKYLPAGGLNDNVVATCLKPVTTPDLAAAFGPTDRNDHERRTEGEQVEKAIRTLSSVSPDESPARKVLQTAGIAGTHSKVEVLNELDTVFYKTDSTELKLKILSAYAKFGAGHAAALISSKLDYPVRAVQLLAARLLFELNFTTSVMNNVMTTKKIVEVAGTIAWLNASILDVRDDPAATPLLAALRNEKDEYLTVLFMLLSFSYGYSTVDLIRSNLFDKRDTDDYIFALEIAANTFDENIRTIVFPLVENITIEKSLERLGQSFPQQKLSTSQRAINILYKDYTMVNVWTKVNALLLLDTHYHDDESKSEILACLYHESQIMREVTHEILVRRASDEMEKPLYLFNGLTRNKQHTTLYEKVTFLRSTKLFRACSEYKLIPIASFFEIENYREGTKVAVRDECLIVVSGTAIFYGTGRLELKSKPFFVIIQELNPAARIEYCLAEESCTVMRCDKRKLTDHLSDDLDLIHSLVIYARG